MPITIVKSGSFKKHFSQTKRVASNEPVFITEYGRPAYVLLSFAAYRELAGDQRSLIDRFSLSTDTAGANLPRSTEHFHEASDSD